MLRVGIIATDRADAVRFCEEHQIPFRGSVIVTPRSMDGVRGMTSLGVLFITPAANVHPKRFAMVEVARPAIATFDVRPLAAVS